MCSRRCVPPTPNASTYVLGRIWRRAGPDRQPGVVLEQERKFCSASTAASGTSLAAFYGLGSANIGETDAGTFTASHFKTRSDGKPPRCSSVTHPIIQNHSRNQKALPSQVETGSQPDNQPDQGLLSDFPGQEAPN